MADQSSRGSGNSGHLTPGAESGGAGGPVIGGGETMAAELDAAMGREEALRVTR